MSKKQLKQDNAEFAAVDAALKRAAKTAHALARKTKTPCYIWKDGAIVDLSKQRKIRKRNNASDGQ